MILNHWPSLQPDEALAKIVAAAMIGLFAISALLATRININEFSMHHFYKNRLVRCYLGASRGRRRRPNAWTGFDPQDDLPLKNLCADAAYFGPFPIVNTAINLNSGSELATQERKAGSFFYTPLYCGFTPESSQEDQRQVDIGRLSKHGYRSTNEYSGKGGPHIGSAMADLRSGGQSQHGFSHFRSGRASCSRSSTSGSGGGWATRARIKRRGGLDLCSRSGTFSRSSSGRRTTDPATSIFPTAATSITSVSTSWCARRCRFIIIGDGEQDPGLNCGSLAAAIRKCQTDFGVTIDIDIRGIQEKNGLSGAHCVVGTIEYPEQDATGAAPWLDDRNRTGAPSGCCSISRRA